MDDSTGPAPSLAKPAAGAAPPAVADPRENIALHRPYTLDPAPNYPYCTNSDDATKLTDGQYTKGYFWTQKTTVGWENVRQAVITIDLGRVEPICGLSYNTAAGTAVPSGPRH